MSRQLRRDGVETWLRRRGLLTERHGTTTVCVSDDLAVRVVPGMGGPLPGRMRPGQLLDTIASETGRTPMFVRTTDKDPGRCQVTLRLDDLLPMLAAYEEEKLR